MLRGKNEDNRMSAKNVKSKSYNAKNDALRRVVNKTTCHSKRSSCTNWAIKGARHCIMNWPLAAAFKTDKE